MPTLSVRTTHHVPCPYASNVFQKRELCKSPEDRAEELVWASSQASHERGVERSMCLRPSLTPEHPVFSAPFLPVIDNGYGHFKARTFKKQNKKGTLLWNSVSHIGVAMRNEPPAVGISHPPLGVILLYPCQYPELCEVPRPYDGAFCLGSFLFWERSRSKLSSCVALRRTPSSWAGLLPLA